MKTARAQEHVRSRGGKSVETPRRTGGQQLAEEARRGSEGRSDSLAIIIHPKMVCGFVFELQDVWRAIFESYVSGITNICESSFWRLNTVEMSHFGGFLCSFFSHSR